MSQYGRGAHRGGSGLRPDKRGETDPRSAQPRETVASGWPDYLRNGYFDDEGNLRIDYVSRERVEPLARDMCSGRDGLTAHQIRRFFGHCRAIETRLRSGGEATWDAVLPEIKKLDIAAADGIAKRPQPKIPSLFHDFIRRNVAAVQSERDFLSGFLPHFEALVGFGSAYFRRDRS